MTTGQKIAALRREKGMSQEALGEALGLSRQAVSKWEADQAVPTMDNLVELNRLFGVSVDTLLRQEEALPDKAEEAPADVKITAEGLKVSYAPVLTKKTKRFVIVVAVLIAVSVLGNLYAIVWMRAMQAQVDGLTNQLHVAMETAEPAVVGADLENMSPEISEASIKCGFDGQNYVLSIDAVPVIFDAAEKAQIVLRDHGAGMYFDAVSYQNGMYTATVCTAVGNFTDFSVYLQLTKGEQTRSLLIGECRGIEMLSALDASVYPEFSWSGNTLHAFTTKVEVNMQSTPWGERPTTPVSGTAQLHIDGITVEEQPLIYENRDTASRDEQVRFTCWFDSHEAAEDQNWEVWVRIMDNFGREHLFIAGK